MAIGLLRNTVLQDFVGRFAFLSRTPAPIGAVVFNATLAPIRIAEKGAIRKEGATVASERAQLWFGYARGQRERKQNKKDSEVAHGEGRPNLGLATHLVQAPADAAGKYFLDHRAEHGHRDFVFDVPADLGCPVSAGCEGDGAAMIPQR